MVKGTEGGWRFDRTVNPGTIAAVIVCLGGAAAAWTAQDRRITIVEVRVEQAITSAETRAKENRQTLHELRQDVQALTGAVYEVAATHSMGGSPNSVLTPRYRHPAREDAN